MLSAPQSAVMLSKRPILGLLSCWGVLFLFSSCLPHGWAVTAGHGQADGNFVRKGIGPYDEHSYSIAVTAFFLTQPLPVQYKQPRPGDWSGLYGDVPPPYLRARQPAGLTAAPAPQPTPPEIPAAGEIEVDAPPADPLEDLVVRGVLYVVGLILTGLLGKGAYVNRGPIIERVRTWTDRPRSPPDPGDPS